MFVCLHEVLCLLLQYLKANRKLNDSDKPGYSFMFHRNSALVDSGSFGDTPETTGIKQSLSI